MDEFKRETVAQVVDRGYLVAEVSAKAGVSTKSLYTWKAQFSQPRKQIIETTEQTAEIRRSKKELPRVSEEHDILYNRSGLGPACAQQKHPELCCAIKGSGRSLIGGLS
ncbi:transposase [Litoreibacter albidus]|uniref:transposase n=1 Tax=Litoreibacter albidus TaxID=670155 RepID=UPI0037360B4A